GTEWKGVAGPELGRYLDFGKPRNIGRSTIHWTLGPRDRAEASITRQRLRIADRALADPKARGGDASRAWQSTNSAHARQHLGVEPLYRAHQLGVRHQRVVRP